MNKIDDASEQFEGNTTNILVNTCDQGTDERLEEVTTHFSSLMDAQLNGNESENNIVALKTNVELDHTYNSMFVDVLSKDSSMNSATGNYAPNVDNLNNLDLACDTDQIIKDDISKMDCQFEESNIDKEAAAPFPSYNFDNILEIAKSTKPFNFHKYLIGCKWSPDGTCLFTNCADYTVRLFDLPKELYNKQSWDRNEVLPDLQPSLKITEGGQIYDYEWYPLMSSWSPETCCFLATSSKAPVHLWDAYSGKIRATYRGYNKVDETDSAYSVKFSVNGEKIYCGYKNEIKIFDTSIPGRDYKNIDTKHVAGQTGIISCIAENPCVQNMFAAGSYKRTIGLYLESGDNICLLNGQRCGVTNIIWSHDGTLLFSGARKDKEILCWDMRNPGEVLYSMERIVNTNQRIYFDLTPDGKYLISGGTDGELTIWDLKQTDVLSGKKSHIFKYKSHLDCVNGVSFHRHLPLLATSSGQHHFPDLTSDDEDNDTFKVKNMLFRIENSVKLWWIGNLLDN